MQTFYMGEAIMGNLLLALFFGTFFFIGCSADSVQREKEQEVLNALQNGIWGGGAESVAFDEETKTYEMVSKSFAAMANRELSGDHRWIGYEEWNHFVNARIKDLFEDTEEDITLSKLGSGYSIKKVCPTTEETLLIVTDGKLVYDIVNGYANEKLVYDVINEE